MNFFHKASSPEKQRDSGAYGRQITEFYERKSQYSTMGRQSVSEWEYEKRILIEKIRKLENALNENENKNDLLEKDKDIIFSNFENCMNELKRISSFGSNTDLEETDLR